MAPPDRVQYLCFAPAPEDAAVEVVFATGVADSVGDVVVVAVALDGAAEGVASVPFPVVAALAYSRWMRAPPPMRGMRSRERELGGP